MNEIKHAELHIPETVMERYVLGQLPDREREQAESHLLTCDHCLQLFMIAEQQKLDPQVRIPDMRRLEQRVISRLVSDQQKPVRRIYWLQRSVVQYTIAASITLLLLASGMFSGVTEKLAELELRATIEQQQQSQPAPASDHMPRESWSDQMVSRTGSWLDSLKAYRFDNEP